MSFVNMKFKLALDLIDKLNIFKRLNQQKEINALHNKIKYIEIRLYIDSLLKIEPDKNTGYRRCIIPMNTDNWVCLEENCITNKNRISFPELLTECLLYGVRVFDNNGKEILVVKFNRQKLIPNNSAVIFYANDIMLNIE